MHWYPIGAEVLYEIEYWNWIIKENLNLKFRVNFTGYYI